VSSITFGVSLYIASQGTSPLSKREQIPHFISEIWAKKSVAALNNGHSGKERGSSFAVS